METTESKANLVKISFLTAFLCYVWTLHQPGVTVLLKDKDPDLWPRILL